MKINVKISQIAKLNESNIDLSKFDTIEYLDTSSITENNIKNIQKFKLGIDSIPSRAKRVLSKNTIVYSMVRPRLKHYGIINCKKENMVASTGFVTLDVIDSKIIDPCYLYYCLTQEKYTEYLAQIADTNASSYPAINPNDLGELNIEIFKDLPTQQKIAAVLSSLDQKIEINNTINAELETLAKTIYDYWFVQFEFPDENGKPYKSSGGKMVYNEKLKREIPQWWEVESIADKITIIRGVTYGKNNISDIATTSHATLLRANNILNGTINYDNIVFIDKDNINANQYLSKSSVFLCMSSGSKEHIGKTALIVNDTELSFGAFCAKIEVISSLFCWLGIYFRGYQFNTYVRNQCIGTNINNLNNGLLNNIELPTPPRIVTDKFQKKILPLLKKQSLLHNETQQLAALRDWLLPMLMNGQVTVE